MHEFEPNTPPAAAPRVDVLAWLREGARAALFLRPRPKRLSAHAGWALLTVGVGVLLQRLVVDGDVTFHPSALAMGWLVPVLTAWLCWVAVGASAARVVNLLLAKELCVALVMAAAAYGVASMHAAGDAQLVWGVYIVWLVWSVASGLVAVWRLGRPRRWLRGVVVLGFVAVAAAQWWGPSATYWYPTPSLPAAQAAQGDEAVDDAEDDEHADAPTTPLWTQALLEAQSAAVVTQLAALAPGRPRTVDLYAITFAPFADEDVFSREATMVTEVMRQRFDADGRVLRLQNHASSVGDTPWATPLNLQRAIHAAAAKMNRDDDVLFLHLTSHGARDGQLAASFWPLDVAPVTPQLLRAWLDAAGVRHRVISISACFSGSWIAPLAGPDTLVMTAADADHTSYGCGRQSELTFFGRAMYDEQLRTQTRSFEVAHAASRTVIDQREKAAGKSDGYSNPQIAMGAAIRPVLAALAAGLEVAGAASSR